MMFDVVFLPRAVKDIEEASDYYFSKNEELEEKFLMSIEKAVQNLKQTPFLQIRYNDYRYITTKKFPYILVYHVDEKKKIVYVLSVFNTLQNPTKQPDRK